jgi:hypothetical protein
VRSLLRRLASIGVRLPLGRGALGRYVVWRAPVLVISYPKSGRTWLRFMIGNALRDHFGITQATDDDLVDIHRLPNYDARVPHIRFTHDDLPHTKHTSRLETDKRRYRKKKVVLLVRDPRDVIVSSFHHHTRRSERVGDVTFSGDLSSFIRHPTFGISNLVAFMNIWAANREVPAALMLLRYEDLHASSETALRKVLAFVGVEDVAAETVARATGASSFEQMQAIERSGALATDAMRPGDVTDASSYKVRRGRIGGYVDEMDDTDIAFVDAAIAKLDPWFGYVG